MNRHKKNQIDIKIDNFSQKGLSSSGEILRSTFSMIKKKIHRSRVILVFDLRVPNLTNILNPQENCPGKLLLYI